MYFSVLVSVSRKQILSLIYPSFVKFHFLTQGKAFKNRSFGALLGTTSQKNCVSAAWRESFNGAMGIQHSPEPCAGAVKENLGKLSILEKGNKVKTPFGDITVSGRNIQKRKGFCRATSWEALLFANSSLLFKGLSSVNILQDVNRVRLRPSMSRRVYQIICLQIDN